MNRSQCFAGPLALLIGLAFPAAQLGAQQRPDGSAASPAPAEQQRPGAFADGRQVFLDSCAACHGGDGRGVDRALVAFEEEVPDFSDCSFASREPAADWLIIAQQGGPVRGFSQMMPSFGEARSEDELARAIAHIQSFCQDASWPRGELNLPRSLATEKAYPEDEWVLENEVELEDGPAIGHALIYEKRFGARSQLELELPLAYRREEAADGGGWSGGVGDIAVALKQVLSHGLDSGHILSAVLETKIPTGDAARGFGSGAWGFEGFLTYGQILPSEMFLQGQVGAERSTASGAETELFWTAALGWSYARNGWGRVWTPMLEVAGVREGDEGTVWDVLPQLHVTLNTRQHVMLSVGPRIPVSGSERSTVLNLALIWDWFDGGLLAGW